MGVQPFVPATPSVRRSCLSQSRAGVTETSGRPGLLRGRRDVQSRIARGRAASKPGARGLGSANDGGSKPTSMAVSRKTAMRCTTSDAPSIGNSLEGKTVVLIGGTGRVGASTAAALLAESPGLKVKLASRSESSWNEAVDFFPELSGTEFARCDIDNPTTLNKVMAGADLVVHTAGPFQQKADCSVLEAAIETGTPYLDVCDDMAYSQRTKRLHESAVQAGVPAITTGGIYPGVSNLMAAQIIASAQSRGGEGEGEGQSQSAAAEEQAEQQGKLQPERVLYSYFTAGSGGVGPTILETTLLLAGEPVEAFRNGAKQVLPPASNRRVVDFGPGVGRRSVFLYNLPEVASTHRLLGVPNVSARFGTDPEIWNILMWLTARIFPAAVLQNRAAVKALASLVGPVVRAVDNVVGERVAMRVEVELEGGKSAGGIFVHEKLSHSVGICTAAFALAMLEGGTQPGVWFPEEPAAVKDRRQLLQRASKGCERFELNRAVWELEGDPVQIGMGFYW